MKYLFLDTNVYLHYIDVEEIDWKSLVTGGEDFTIVIPPIVREEIDKKKDQARGKIQHRAKKISSKFANIFLEEKKMKYKYSDCKNPTNDLFEKYQFDKDTNDDKLLLSAILFDPTKDNIILVSADNNILIKAKTNGVPYFRMPKDGEHLLKEEKTEEEKEIEKLKEELDIYKNRKPNPQITFEDGSTMLKLKKPTPKDLEIEIEKYLEKEKLKYPRDSTYDTGDYLDGAIRNTLHSIMGDFSAEQILKYNIQREEYLKEYKEYIRFIVQNEIFSEQLKELKFTLSNTGNAQTGDMNIFINIPQNIKLYSKKSKIKRIKSVLVPPQKNGLNRKVLQATANIQPLESYLPNYEYCWDLNNRLTNNEFLFDESKLNHTLHKNLNIEDSLFIDTLSCRNFSIDWYIIDSALPKPVEGQLKVIIEE